MPGRASSARPLRTSSVTASAAARPSSVSSSRRRRNRGRSRRGMVSTTWRCATLASTSSHSHSAHKICRFFSHDGQKDLPRQKKATSTLLRHSEHHSRAKPCSSNPHRRNSRSTRSTTVRSGPWWRANRRGESRRQQRQADSPPVTVQALPTTVPGEVRFEADWVSVVRGAVGQRRVASTVAGRRIPRRPRRPERLGMTGGRPTALPPSASGRRSPRPGGPRRSPTRRATGPGACRRRRRRRAPSSACRGRSPRCRERRG